METYWKCDVQLRRLIRRLSEVGYDIKVRSTDSSFLLQDAVTSSLIKDRHAKVDLNFTVNTTAAPIKPQAVTMLYQDVLRTRRNWNMVYSTLRETRIITSDELTEEWISTRLGTNFSIFLRRHADAKEKVKQANKILSRRQARNHFRMESISQDLDKSPDRHFCTTEETTRSRNVQRFQVELPVPEIAHTVSSNFTN